MSLKMYCLTLFFLIFSIFSHAQKDPIQWGEIPQEDFDLQVYIPDSTASAIVLGDYGKLRFDFGSGDFTYILERHRRIKVFSRAGFDQGDIELPYYNFRKDGKISGLKVQVFAPDGTKQELSKKEVFTEQISEFYAAKKFSVPNLQEGSIIEFKYTLVQKHNANLAEWYFQDEIPVRWSEYRLEIPEWYDYLTLSLDRSLDIHEVSQKNTTITFPDYRPDGNGNYFQAGFQNIQVNVQNYRLAMKDVPAFKREKFLTTPRDYMASIKFQLRSVKYPNTPRENILTNWEDVAQSLLESDAFGNQYNKKSNYNAVVKAAKSSITAKETPAETVAALYSFLLEHVKWDDTYGMYVQYSLNEAFKAKSASSTELNLMLIALLRAYEIPANPVLISTRTHGKAIQIYPIRNQFNHAIVLAEIDGKSTFIDVAKPIRPIGYPAVNSLNKFGFLLKEGASKWINITPPTSKTIQMATMKLDIEGNLVGELKMSSTGYEAVNERAKALDDATNEHLKNRIMKRYPDAKINSIEYDKHKKNIYKPLTAIVNCQLNSAAQIAGDFIYLSPALFPTFDESPFKTEMRTYAVDIPYTIQKQLIVNIEIPEGYLIEELPEQTNVVLPNKGGKFQYLLSQNGNTIQLVCKISVNQLLFFPDEYQTIKNFFDLIIEKQGEQIVLKKV